MRFGAIHQFHSGTSVGDAITNQMLELQRRLRAAGYASEIYSEHIDPQLRERIRPLGELEARPATLLLTHHSMGHTAFADLMTLDVPMVTVFHSITPARFFDDPGLRRFIRIGFDQLRLLAKRSLFGVADSNHNRQQMYDAGFSTVEVMPVRTDYSEHRSVRSDRGPGALDWLFVGRVVPNKRQLELVRAFDLYHASSPIARLHLVGDVSLQGYVEQIHGEVARRGLRDAVVVHGKVSQAELLARYRDAGLFACLSEHEGFGVPLLEAMAAGLPVVARGGAAVDETLGGAGVLLERTDPMALAAAARMLESDPELRSRIVQHQDERLARIEGFDVDAFLARLAARAGGAQLGTSVQIQGPFETSYSLAILNRELALALARHPDLDVSIHATEGPGDYTPRDDDLVLHPDAAELYVRGGSMPFPEVAIRQMFPPRVHDSTAGMTFQYFGWEESRLPDHIVADFNRHLDGIGTMSTFVKTLLAESGVVVPMAVVGVGVHAPAADAVVDAPELHSLRTTRFLHISSAFPRKGVDVLLRAYFEAFDGDDDVSLVLKTFPNPHNTVGQQLRELHDEFSNPPHVCWIDRDLDRDQLDGLYRISTCYVHAARGEGFGLPVAEAMLARVPVISVDSTGLADFVSERTAAVVGHELAPAASHVSVPGSMWAEPSLSDLVRELQSAAEGRDPELRAARVDAAHDLIVAEHTWTRVGERWHDFVTRTRASRSGHVVATVTTFNSRCGIAEYSAHLYEPIAEWAHLEIYGDRGVAVHDVEIEEQVRRAWSNHRAGPIDTLLDALDESDAEIVHLQYNMGFFAISELGRLIRHETPRRPVVVTLHRTLPVEVEHGIDTLATIVDDLRLAGAIIVHQRSDQQRLAELGVASNVHLMLHGTEALTVADVASARLRHGVPAHAFVLGTYGFLLPHKGVLSLLEAIAVLRRRGIDAQLVATCALHPDPSSPQHLLEVEAAIDRLGLRGAVRLVTEFLDPEVSRDLLACADVLVLPYEQTNESASGALRSVLPLGKAMVTSRLPIFEDVLDVVRSLPAPVEPDALADLLEELWLDDAARDEVARRVRTFADATSWATVARRTRQLYADLLSERAAAGPAGSAASLATTTSGA